jgi:hypothetical protein
MRWSYKTIHYELKKEGILGSAFLDESEIELSLNQYGKAGWELVSMLETMDGIIAVFKQPLDMDIRSFTSPADSPERLNSSPEVRKKQTKALESKKDEKIDLDILDEDMVEAMLLDEFEVVEDSVEETETKAPVLPVDVGLIRIE